MNFSTSVKSKGRAEPARLILAHAGVQYTDTRFKDRENDWPNNYKKRSPFGMAPFMEVDGEAVIGGSREIARFLGEELGLAGSNNIQNAQIASIADHVDDMLTALLKIIEVKAEDMAKTKQDFVEKSPKWLSILEDKITANGWLYGDKLTWADLYTYHYLTSLKAFDIHGLLKDYPKLTALQAAVESQPNIAKWIKERPQTDY